MRALVVALVVSFALPAAAQDVAPPPKVPDVPDVPLPEWHAPPPGHRNALFLSVSPEMGEAQKIRQAGLWISSAGWIQLLACGILYGWAADINQDVGHPHANGSGMVNTNNDITQTQMFDPSLEDERDHILLASKVLLGVGGAMAVGGFVVYTIGQWKMTKWHHEHPRDPMPPLSGF